jgi:putative membrane protein
LVVLVFLNPKLQSFTEVCGACERIKNTPIPDSYSVFIKKFIFFYIMTLPFGADENDLPLGKMSRNIQVHIGELI